MPLKMDERWLLTRTRITSEMVSIKSWVAPRIFYHPNITLTLGMSKHSNRFSVHHRNIQAPGNLKGNCKFKNEFYSLMTKTLYITLKYSGFFS